MPFTREGLTPRKLGRPKGQNKITEDIKFDMRVDRLKGSTIKEIANKYDVAFSTVQKVINEKRPT